MHIKIITPTGTLFEGEAERSIQLPSVMGRMQVLHSHAPLLAALQKGNVEVDEQVFAIEGGMAKVENDEILVCAN